MQVPSLSLEDPLQKGMATHSSILAWRISWTEEPGRLQSTGSQRVGHDWVTNTFTPYSLPHPCLLKDIKAIEICGRPQYRWKLPSFPLTPHSRSSTDTPNAALPNLSFIPSLKSSVLPLSVSTLYCMCLQCISPSKQLFLLTISKMGGARGSEVVQSCPTLCDPMD